MLRMTELETTEQFEAVKKGDILVVEWDKFFVKHHEGSEKRMVYVVELVKPNQQEIILRLHGNHYFNWYCKVVEKTSHADRVIKIEVDDV